MQAESKHDRAYLLGHSDWEIARLNRQAGLVDPITRKLFADAGLTSGMRVLDLGSGSGSVSLIAAQIVGPRGSVVGVDLSPAAAKSASLRMNAAGFDNVEYRVGQPADVLDGEIFDAVIGRYILMFLPEPSAMLRELATYLEPGGIVAFHEPAWERLQFSIGVPTYDRSVRWCVDAMSKQGANVQMGAQLYSAFVAAGLPPPTLSLCAGIGAGVQGHDWAELVIDLLQTLGSDAIRLGIAQPDDLDFDHLRHQVDRELDAQGSIVFGRSEICAWTRTATN